MKLSNAKTTRTIFLLLFLLIVCTYNFPWAPQVQTNFLIEAIRILPWYQYLMCKDYKNALIEGIVEAEYQFWFNKSGNCIGLNDNIIKEKMDSIKGWMFQEEDISKAAEFLARKFDDLKSDIRAGNRRYREILFELGYYLHPINNYLKPPYFHKGKPTKEEREYHSNCTRLAQNTEHIDLKTHNVEKISDLKSWLETMLEKDLLIRQEWYEEAETNKKSYDRFTELASRTNIYNLASIIRYVLSDLQPKGSNPEVQDRVLEKIDKLYKGGRKPSIKY